MFSPFEIMVAGRYLRARKAEGFVSVIAGFSFLGIMLGVATLIIVMAVMNGFRDELVTRILGLNGHINVYSRAAQVFFQLPGSVTALEVITADPVHLDKVREGIDNALGGRMALYDWHDMNGSFFNALNVERNVMFLILTMIIIVAAFNIISSMIMLVKDKGHDIAIMRTMGAPRESMMKIFMLTGATIGFAGTFAGSILGILFALNIESIRQWLQGLTGTELFSAEIYFLSQLPAVIEWHEVIAVVVMAFVLSILATIYPAWRAARLDPVEALRYE